jgi:hypothetical protein
MHRIISILLLTFSLTSVFSQQNQLLIKLVSESYQWPVSEEKLDSFYFNLLPVKYSNYLTHIRIHLPGQRIDLVSKNNIEYQGILTNYTIQLKYFKDKQLGIERSRDYQYFIEKLPIDNKIAENAAKLLIQSGLPFIPSDSIEKYWHKNFLDCNIVRFDYLLNGNYHTQDFYCPSGQKDSITMIKNILSSIDFIQHHLKLDSLYDSFTDRLPKGMSYSNDGFLHMYTMTKKQVQIWDKNKPKREYLHSIKDTIDSIIRHQLSIADIDFTKMHCFNTFHLKFNPQGRILKISVSDPPKLFEYGYFEERREIRKCKKALKSELKKVDLTRINIKYEFFRTIMFRSNNKFLLIDNTIY